MKNIRRWEWLRNALAFHWYVSIFEPHSGIVLSELAITNHNYRRVLGRVERPSLFFSGYDFQFRIQCLHPYRASNHNQSGTASGRGVHPQFRVQFRFEQPRLANPCRPDFLTDQLSPDRSSNVSLSSLSSLFSTSHYKRTEIYCVRFSIKCQQVPNKQLMSSCTMRSSSKNVSRNAGGDAVSSCDFLAPAMKIKATAVP